MGYILGEMQLMMLTNEVNTLQQKLNNMTTTKSDIADQIANLTAQISELDSDDATVKQLNAKKARFEAMEKRIDQQIKLYETKITKANSELQQVEQMISQGIKLSTPRYCGLGGQ